MGRIVVARRVRRMKKCGSSPQRRKAGAKRLSLGRGPRVQDEGRSKP